MLANTWRSKLLIFIILFLYTATHFANINLWNYKSGTTHFSYLRPLLYFRVKRIPNDPSFCLLHQFFLKFIIDPFLNEYTWTCNTNFSLLSHREKTKYWQRYNLMLFEKKGFPESNFTLLYRMPIRASSAALSISASSKIMRGDLPPNSSETCFKLLLAAACIITRPVCVEPVKLTWTYHQVRKHIIE